MQVRKEIVHNVVMGQVALISSNKVLANTDLSSKDTLANGRTPRSGVHEWIR